MLKWYSVIKLRYSHKRQLKPPALNVFQGIKETHCSQKLCNPNCFPARTQLILTFLWLNYWHLWQTLCPWMNHLWGLTKGALHVLITVPFLWLHPRGLQIFKSTCVCFCVPRVLKNSLTTQSNTTLSDWNLIFGGVFCNKLCEYLKSTLVS